MLLTAERLKKELYNPEFRNQYPGTQEAFNKYFMKPACPCNHGLFVTLLSQKDILEKWFAQSIEFDAELQGMLDAGQASSQEWTVINVNKDEAEKVLNALPKGGVKSWGVARYGDEVTIIIRDLSFED